MVAGAVVMSSPRLLVVVTRIASVTSVVTIPEVTPAGKVRVLEAEGIRNQPIPEQVKADRRKLT
jgi:hypothetical protein